MNESNKYTFEIWLNNTEDTYSEIIEGVDEFKFQKTGKYPEYLLRHGKITREEFEKIRKEQEKAYRIALDHYSNKRIEALKQQVETTSEAKQYLKHRKNKLENIFEKANQEIMEKVSAEKVNYRAIDAIMYRQIMNNTDEPPKLLYLPDELIDQEAKRGDYKVSRQFELAILFEEYKYINKHINQSEDKNIKLSREALIKEFSKKFSEEATYSSNIIFAYLKEWVGYQGLSYPRAKAKKQISENYDVPADGTLKNWEEKWTHFYDSRTGK